MLSRLAIAFLPRNKCLLISWLPLPSAVILEPPKIKSATVLPSTYYEVMGPDAMILVFWLLNFKWTFSLSSFTFIKSLFSSSSLSSIRLVNQPHLNKKRSKSENLSILPKSIIIAYCIWLKWPNWITFTFFFSQHTWASEEDHISYRDIKLPLLSTSGRSVSLWPQEVWVVVRCCFL